LKGDSKAQIELGWMYLRGIAGLPADSKQAFYWWTKAAEQGDSRAQDLLERLNKLGKRVPKD
jgi:hypothetical protein